MTEMEDIELKNALLRACHNVLEAANKLDESLTKSNETLDAVIKNQLEIKHTLTEIKNIIQTPNSRTEERKNQVKDLKCEEAKNTQPEKQNEKESENMRIV